MSDGLEYMVETFLFSQVSDEGLIPLDKGRYFDANTALFSLRLPTMTVNQFGEIAQPEWFAEVEWVVLGDVVAVSFGDYLHKLVPRSGTVWAQEFTKALRAALAAMCETGYYNPDNGHQPPDDAMEIMSALERREALKELRYGDV